MYDATGTVVIFDMGCYENVIMSGRTLLKILM